MTRHFAVNGEPVTPEQYANFMTDLLASGRYTITSKKDTSRDTPKMIRETLCVAQPGIGALMREGQVGLERHMDRLQRLIDLMDLLRPLGPDGRHGDRHTTWCGCEDK